MPIVEPADPDAPLNQGDILKGIPLYATSSSWLTGKLVAERIQAEACLVLSRPCVVCYKDRIVVAPIGVHKDNRSKDDLKSYEDVKEFLEVARDGRVMPDRFYLAQIPQLGAGRYCLFLDALQTINLPPKEQLSAHLQKFRVARLSEDFRRDLHTRIFSSFANMGFDDDSWYSNEDLQWLVSVAEGEIAALGADVARAKAEGKQNLGAERIIKEKKENIGPLKAELELRTKASKAEEPAKPEKADVTMTVIGPTPPTQVPASTQVSTATATMPETPAPGSL